ncbi:MAG: TonB-dependent receptor [Bacteroidales bacterium]|nr:TonB-dependent receptor [Bacteroidales bacterium]
MFVRRLWRLIFLAYSMLAVALGASAQSSGSPLSSRVELDALYRGSSDSLINILSEKTGVVISYSNRVYSPAQIALPYKTGTLHQFLNDIFYRFPTKYVEKSGRIIIAPDKTRYFRVSGYCRDSLSNESLIGANVYDTLLLVGQATNDYGFYSINIPEGHSTIRSSYVGYKTKTCTFEISNDTIINFLLAPSLTMKEIEVSVSPSDMGSAKMGTIEMPLEQVRAMPSLLGEADVIKAFQMTPGVQSGEEGYGGLSVRGGGADQNIVLLDDVPLYGPNHLMGLYTIFNIETVNKATLVKSGFPARYGGRLSSVLDVKTKEGNMKEYKGLINAGVFASNVMFEGPVIKDKISFIVTGRRTYFDLFSAQLQRNKEHKYSFYFYDISAKLNWILSRRDRIYLSYFTGFDDLRCGYNYRNIEITYNKQYSKTISLNDDQELRWGNTITSLRWNHIWGNSLFSNTTLALSRYKFNNDLTSQSEAIYTYKNEYYSGLKDICARIDFNWTPAFMQSVVRMGANFTYHEFMPSFSTHNTGAEDSETGNGIDDDELVFKNGSSIYRFEYHGYLEDKFEIGALSANVGVHLSALNRSHDNPYIRIEPRASVQYEFRNGITTKLGFSDMTQFLQLMRLTSVASPADIWLPISSEAPPRAMQYSFETNFPISKNFYITTELYHKQYINQQTYKSSPLNSVLTPQEWNSLFVIGKGYANGLELFVHRKEGRFSGWAGYAISKSMNKFDELNGGKYFRTDNDRTHTLSVFSCYKINNNFELSAVWTYSTGSPLTIPSQCYSVKGDSNLPNNVVFSIEGQRNAYRMPNSHMLNIGANIYRDNGRTTSALSFGIYNVYAQKNPIFVYWSRGDESKNEPYKLKQFNLIAWPWPYVRYSISF